MGPKLVLQLRAKTYLILMAKKWFLILDRSSELDAHHQIEFIVICSIRVFFFSGISYQSLKRTTVGGFEASLTGCRLFLNIFLWSYHIISRKFTVFEVIILFRENSQFLSGIRDASKAGSLWEMMRGVGGVRKSIHQSWLVKGSRLGLGLLCWGFKGVQEKIRSEEASTLQIGSVAFSLGQCTVFREIF